MSAKFQNKYRQESTRLQNWNYGWKAAYFVTICTKNRSHFFGEVVDGKMSLSEIGRIAESEWIKTPGIRPDMNLKLGEFVVMPDHFHGIIIIGKNEFNRYDITTPINKTPQNKFGPQSKNLASILRGFKSAVTIQSRKIDADFGWQSRFHDHIIRDDQAFDRISNYIRNNPRKWSEDRYGK